MIQTRYSLMQPEQERKRDRIQLFGSAFVLFVTLMDVFDDPTTVTLVLGFIGVLIGIVHLYCAIRYDHLKNFMGSRFETILFQLTAVPFIINGLMLQAQGSRTVYLINYVLAGFYLFVMPILISRFREQALLQVDGIGFHFSYIKTRNKTIPWTKITDIDIMPDCITLHQGRRRPRHFWLEGETTSFVEKLDRMVDKYKV
jgi:hypothetical protein